jgi:hypothetical protein
MREIIGNKDGGRPLKWGIRQRKLDVLREHVFILTEKKGSSLGVTVATASQLNAFIRAILTGLYDMSWKLTR